MRKVPHQVFCRVCRKIRFSLLELVGLYITMLHVKRSKFYIQSQKSFEFDFDYGPEQHQILLGL